MQNWTVIEELMLLKGLLIGFAFGFILASVS